MLGRGTDACGVACTSGSTSCESVRECARNRCGRPAQVVQTQALIRGVTVCLGQCARSRAVEHGGDSGSGIVAGIGIKRHAVLRNGYAEERLPMAAQCVCQPLGAGYVDQGECQKNAAHLHANAAESGRRALNGPAQLCFGVSRALLRDNAPVDAKAHAIGHDVGIDTTLYEPYVDRWMRNARNVRAAFPQDLAGVVDAFQNTGCGCQRINPRLGHCRMALAPADRDFQVQTTVVRRSHRVRKSRANRIVRATQALGEQPARPDIPADLFIVGEMQLDAAVERSPTCGELLQRAQRVCVGREVGLAHGNSTAVHGWSLRRVVYYIRAVRIVRPSQTGRYHVAVRIECNARSVLAEAVPNDEMVAEIMPAARTESTGTGWASTVNPNASSRARARSACAAQSPGGLSVGTLTSAARKSHSAAKLSSTILPTAVSRADLPGGSLS